MTLRTSLGSLLARSLSDSQGFQVIGFADFGIYGDDAVGMQVVDFEGKTKCFHMYFGPDRVREAEDRWDRLLLYSVLLDDRLAGKK